MSAYFTKGKGWRYDFQLNGSRHSSGHFKTRAAAREAEAKERGLIKEGKKIRENGTIRDDMDFKELLTLHLDHLEAYRSKRHYQEHLYHARRWLDWWGNTSSNEVITQGVQEFMLHRAKVSSYTANKELRHLRATFNFGKRKGYISFNPTDGMEFMPVEKRIRYVPPVEDIDLVTSVADPDTQDYFWAIRDTLARVSEINQLTWDDINFSAKQVVLYTRKKRGGHLTPRVVPMTDRLHRILVKKASRKASDTPWVFWHRFWDRKAKAWRKGPYKQRKRLMTGLCRKAGVKPFGFHALRHSGASIMDMNNVPIGSIQRILGHESRVTTEIYLHSIGQAEREAIAVYEQSREKSHIKSHIERNKGLH